MDQVALKDQWCGLISHNLHLTIVVALTNEPFKKKIIVHNSEGCYQKSMNKFVYFVLKDYSPSTKKTFFIEIFF
jgi:hypothetical protein